MSLVKARGARQAEPDPENELRALRCSFPGCQLKWSVKIDRPMCSYHQWGKGPYSEPAGDYAQQAASKYPGKDGRQWAYRLQARHKAGDRLTPAQIDAYRSVVGMDEEANRPRYGEPL